MTIGPLILTGELTEPMRQIHTWALEDPEFAENILEYFKSTKGTPGQRVRGLMCLELAMKGKIEDPSLVNEYSTHAASLAVMRDEFRHKPRHALSQWLDSNLGTGVAL